MKKLFSFLIAATLFAVNSWALDIEAPTYPDWVAPDSGGVYYIYNVEADMWMSAASDNQSYLGVSKTGRPILVQKYKDGSWSLKWNDSEYYIERRSDSYLSTWSISSTTYSKFSFVLNEDVYNIQSHAKNSKYYNANQWLGWVGETSNYIYANRALGENTSWKFANADKAEHYFAECTLHEVLTSNGENFKNNPLFMDCVNIYQNRLSHSTEELNKTIMLVNNLSNYSSLNSIVIDSNNEVPMTISGNDEWVKGNTTIYHSLTTDECSFAAGFTTDKDVTLSYDLRFTGSWYNKNFYTTVWLQSGSVNVDIFLDGKLIQSFNYMPYDSKRNVDNARKYFADIPAGSHVLEWKFKNPYKSIWEETVYINNVCIRETPEISVNLNEAGSLSTEVLYNVNSLKDVRALKISGPMNDEDWEKISMMTGLYSLDLTESTITSIPEAQFSKEDQSNLAYLHNIKLPSSLKTIGANAFKSRNIEKITIPATVENIGEYAFYETLIDSITISQIVNNIGQYAFANNYYLKYADISMSYVPKYAFYDCNFLTDAILHGCTRINESAFAQCSKLRTVNLPDLLNTIGENAFYYCSNLQTINLPNTLNVIDDAAFCNCNNVIIAQLPKSLRHIGNSAFGGCYNLSQKNQKFIIPASVEDIGKSAFANCDQLDSVIIEKTVSVGEYAFSGCEGLSYIEFPTGYYDVSNPNILNSCTNLKTIRLNSPTVITHDNELGLALDSLKIQVPMFLVTSYKSDPYWYNAMEIEGFGTDEIQDWEINSPLVLSGQARMTGSPNIIIGADKNRLPSLKIYGDLVQNISNLIFNGYHQNYNRNPTGYKNYPGQILSNCAKTTVNGKVQTNLFTAAKYWYYFSLPFDVKISDITFDGDNTQFAIRYYDGAGRAENGKTGNWKNFDKENDTIPAGTGFIMQTNVDSWNYFHAMNNETKQNVVSNKEFVKTLAVNASETPSDKGWNLVGNPYQCFYNTHCLNFTAPITVWDVQNKSYTAYSITDDDYALRPNEAFFVQCPNAELNTISFPTQGRQLNDVIESQNAVKAREGLFGRDRQIIDITISSDEASDRTRIVLNEKAQLDYEVNCDAGKFFSDEAETAQIYTIGADGTQYAINERPLEDGTVALGLQSNSGTYTIEMTRCQAEKVYLNDLKNNVSICLNDQSYTFMTDGGTLDDRFTISMSAVATAIDLTEADINADECEVYSVTGVKVAGSLQNLKSGIYVINGKKVLVK